MQTNDKIGSNEQVNLLLALRPNLAKSEQNTREISDEHHNNNRKEISK